MPSVGKDVKTGELYSYPIVLLHRDRKGGQRGISYSFNLPLTSLDDFEVAIGDAKAWAKRKGLQTAPPDGDDEEGDEAG